MRYVLTVLTLALAFGASHQAKAENGNAYGIGAAKVIESTSSYNDGGYYVTYRMVEADEPKIVHTVLFRLNPKEPTPFIVQRLNELAAALSGHELDLSLRCKTPVSSPARPAYDMVKMGCEILSVGHRRPQS